MKTTILTGVSDKTERPARLFYALAAKPVPDAEVLVLDRRGDVLPCLREFAASFRWSYLVPDDAGVALEDLVPEGRVLTVPGFALPVGDAARVLAETTQGHTPADCYDAGVAAVESLDEYGSNLCEALLADAADTHPMVFGDTRESWLLARSPRTVLVSPCRFLLMTPPTYTPAFTRPRPYDRVRVVERNYQ